MTTTKAICLTDLTPYTASDIKLMNRVAAILAKRGAASTEYLAKATRESTLGVSWALWHIGAKSTAAALWVL